MLKLKERLIMSEKKTCKNVNVIHRKIRKENNCFKNVANSGKKVPYDYVYAN